MHLLTGCLLPTNMLTAQQQRRSGGQECSHTSRARGWWEGCGAVRCHDSGTLQAVSAEPGKEVCGIWSNVRSKRLSSDFRTQELRKHLLLSGDLLGLPTVGQVLGSGMNFGGQSISAHKISSCLHVMGPISLPVSQLTKGNSFKYFFS